MGTAAAAGLAACALAAPLLDARAETDEPHAIGAAVKPKLPGPAGGSGPGGATGPAGAGGADPEMCELVGPLRDSGWLRAQLEEARADAARQGAEVGIAVVDVATGQILYAHDADKLINPASNAKLATTAAALVKLGAEYTWRTDVLGDALPEPDGVLKGNLYLRGRGDPKLVTEYLWSLVDRVASAGVKRVSGDLVADDTWFDAERFGAGWEQEESDRAYLAPAGALSLNFNSVTVRVAPGVVGGPARVGIEPPSAYVKLTNEVKTAAKGRRKIRLAAVTDGNGVHVNVRGTVLAGDDVTRFYRRVEDPAAYTAHLFREQLELRGVKITGKVKKGRTPAAAVEIEHVDSPPLGVVVRDVNKESNNFQAEQLVKTLGAEVHGAPGTWPGGLSVIQDVLADFGIPRGSYVLGNGSGLNDVNRMSAMQLTRILRAMWERFDVRDEYVGSLAMAGADGTVRKRFEGSACARKLRVKTGTLTGVSSLSGYAESQNGNVLAFAILFSGFQGRAKAMREVQNEMCEAISSFQGPKLAATR